MTVKIALTWPWMVSKGMIHFLFCFYSEKNKKFQQLIHNLFNFNIYNKTKNRWSNGIIWLEIKLKKINNESILNRPFDCGRFRFSFRVSFRTLILNKYWCVFPVQSGWPLMRLYDTNDHLQIVFESVEFSKLNKTVDLISTQKSNWKQPFVK